jgi:S1-C subfamily serine protease
VRIVLSGRYLPNRDDGEGNSRARESVPPPEKQEAATRRSKPSEFELEQRAGDLVFAAIQPGGAAEKAGVRAGDVLVSIDGEPVLSAAQGRGMLRDPAGHAALIQLRRERAQVRVRYKRPEL